MRVTPDLVVLDTVYICNREGGQNIPAVAFNGENYVTVWYDPGLSAGIVAVRVTPQGAVLDSGVVLGPGDDDPDIASGAGRSLAVWSRDYSGVWGRIVDGQCQPVDTLFRIAGISASGTSAKAASDGQDFLVVWADFGPTGDLDVFGRIVSGSGQMPEAVFSIARGSAIQKDPCLSFDGNRYLVLWLEDASKIVGLFVGTNGKPIGGPFLISDTSSVEHQYPALSATGGDYLAVWAEYHDGFDIYATLGNAIGVSERSAERIANLSAAPNPFRTRTLIRWTMDEGRRTTTNGNIRIYDISGKRTNDLSSLVPSPSCFAVWNGLDREGRVVPGGVYFARSDDGRQLKLIKLE